MNRVLPGQTPARLNFGLSVRISFASVSSAADSEGQTRNSMRLTSFTMRKCRRGIWSGLATR